MQHRYEISIKGGAFCRGCLPGAKAVTFDLDDGHRRKRLTLSGNLKRKQEVGQK